MTVRGSCSCYGHAEKCLPEKPEDEDILGIIYNKVSIVCIFGPRNISKILYFYFYFRYGTWTV